MHRAFITAFVIAAATACAGGKAYGPASQPQIVGNWTLDERDSQNPVTLIGGGRGGFGGTSGTGGFGGRAGGRSGLPRRAQASLDAARSKMESMRERIEVLYDMQNAMKISNDGRALRIDYAIGPEMRYPWSSSQTDSIPTLGEVKTEMSWSDGELKLNTKIGDLKMTEEFMRNSASDRLFVYTTIKGLASPLQYRRVYTRVH